jgi:DNA-binding transcriptional LysR family regulator
MELYQLRTLAAVAELGSLARATARLHLSQPAASAHIKALEEEFGVVLFERKPSGLALTRAGKDLLPHVQRLLAGASDLSARAQRLRGLVGGQLKLGAFLDPELLQLGELMSRLIDRNPILEIEIHHSNSRSILHGVVAGQLDAGIALGDVEVAGVAALPLCKLRYRIVAPASWSERLKGAQLHDLAALPWIAAPKDGSHFRMIESLFRRHGFTPQKVIEADSDASIASLVCANIGMGLMREDVAAQAHRQGTVFMLEQGGATTSLRLIYLSSRENEAAISALRSVLEELWPLPGLVSISSSREAKLPRSP